MVNLGTFSHYTSIDISEVLDDLSDEKLAAYCRERKIPREATENNSFMDLITEAYERLNENDVMGAKLSLEQALFPKFKTIEDCMKLLTARKMAGAA